MRVSAGRAIALRERGEIYVGEGVSRPAVLFDPEFIEKRVADEMRRPAIADVDARLAEIRRQELRMYIREMQQRDVAECRQLVELVGRLREARAGAQRGAARRGEGE